MKTGKKVEMIMWYINLIVLACFSIKIFEIGYSALYLWGGLNVVLYAILYKKTGFDIHSILLLLGMVVYAFIYQRYFPEEVTTKWVTGTALCMPAAYLWGRLLLSNCEENVEKQLSIVIWILVLGMLLHGALNAWAGWREGIFDSGKRVWSDYWTKKDLPATQHVFFFIPVVSVVFVVFFMKWWKSIVILFFVAGSLWFNIVTKSRTIVGSLGCAVIWGVILCIYLNRRNKKALKGMAAGGTALLIILIVAILIYVKKNMPIQESKMYYFLFERGGGIFHNVRFQAQLGVIRQMGIFWAGGRRMELNLYYAHNVWLDMYNAGGIVPFLLFSGYTILSLIDVIKIIVNEKASAKIKMLISSLWLGFVAYYMIEPALDANVLWVAYWCFLGGVIRTYTLKIEKDVTGTEHEGVAERIERK